MLVTVFGLFCHQHLKIDHQECNFEHFLANGVKARAEYYVQYSNGGIELARALYRTELEKTDREDYSELLFGFAQFSINNKLDDELKHAIEK